MNRSGGTYRRNTDSFAAKPVNFLRSFREIHTVEAGIFLINTASPLVLYTGRTTARHSGKLCGKYLNELAGTARAAVRASTGVLRDVLQIVPEQDECQVLHELHSLSIQRYAAPAARSNVRVHALVRSRVLILCDSELCAVNRAILPLPPPTLCCLALPLGSQHSYHFWQTITVWLLNPVHDELSNI